MYSRLATRNAAPGSRHVPGGSFLLRVLRAASRAVGLSTTAAIRGTLDLVVLTDFADDRVLEVIHEIRGENPEYRVMSELLSPGDSFIDVGANFGAFSLLASRLVGATGRVIAAEPQPRLAAFIRESASLSEASNIEVKQEAVGAEASRAELMVPRDDTGRAGFFQNFSGVQDHHRLQVSRTTLDAIAASLPGSGRVLVKIDVEGSEFAVLAGGRELIASRKPAILIELNPWSASAAGRSTAEIVRVLEDSGYNRFVMAETFPQESRVSELPLDRQLNLVALPDSY